MPKTPKLIVIALGGNALNSPEGKGDYLEQLKNAKRTANRVARIIKNGQKVVITHGNGPQVGNILLQQEYSKYYVPPRPLSVCGAESQGQIGTILAETLNNELNRLNLKTRAVMVLTHVLVNQKDPAFNNPTKPIGPIYTPTEAKNLRKQGMMLKKIKIGAYRRVVPSPLPLDILEIEAIRAILKNNLVPIAVGGGGIPVIKKGGNLKLVDAVIDKDLASQVLANQLDADWLIILTNVKKVALNFGKKNQKFLSEVSVSQAKQYLAEGHFWQGSMEPKMRAAIRFIEDRGKMAVIAHLKDLLPALRGQAGTKIIC